MFARIPGDITETLSETICARASGSSRGADWLNRRRELKQAVSLGINSFPLSPPTGHGTHGTDKNLRVMRYRLSKIHRLHVGRRTEKRDRRGGEKVDYGALKMAGLSFTDISTPTIESILLICQGKRDEGLLLFFFCGVSESMTASMRSASTAPTSEGLASNVSPCAGSPPVKR